MKTNKSQRFGNTQNLEGNNRKALPEPRKIKREILYWRKQTQTAATKFFQHDSKRRYYTWRENLLNWYLSLEPYIEDMPEHDSDKYEVLSNIEKWVYKKVQGKDPMPAAETLIEYTRKLNEILKEIGIIDIGIKQDNQKMGYEFLKGLDFNMDTSMANFERLKMNVRNMKSLLRKDVDMMGIIWGGNRVGKDTLALQLADTGSVPQYGGLEPEVHVVLNDEDFWESTNDLPKYSPLHITEMSMHFYSKDAMTSEQKDKKKKMKTFAKNNLFMLGCDTNIMNIDKEILSDKVAFAVRIPERGRFEFYSKQKIKEFEKDSDTGDPVLPKPDFKGRFPKLDGSDSLSGIQRKKEEGENLTLWEKYRLVEEEKDKVREDPEEEEELSKEEVVERCLENPENWIKTYNKRRSVDKDKISYEFDVAPTGGKIKQIKAKLEEEWGLPDKVE